MSTTGQVFVVRAVRADGGAILWRTTDRREAMSVAARFRVSIESE